MKVRITVDPRLMNLLGQKLYSSHPLPIVVRELLQNARDACVRANVKPEIKISVTGADKEYRVVCEDNGIGMTDTQLIEDFLCLGNTSKKEQSSAVGGFGIAKAALMRNPEWSVHSLDNYIDNTFLAEEKEVGKKPFRQGTVVEVLVTEPTSYITIRDMLTLIHFSNAESTFVFKGETTHGSSDVPLLPLGEGPQWKMYGAEQEVFREQEMAGLTIVRLGGLVQFVNKSYSNRMTNIVVDITPEYRPDDEKYPLTMSREELSSAVRSEIMMQVRKHDVNPISMEMQMRKPENEESPVLVKRGTMLQGLRADRDVPIQEDSIFFGFSESQVLFKEYNPKARDLKADSAILQVWQDLVQICASTNDKFGIGLTLDPNVRAERYYEDGSYYYLINPTILDGIATTKGMILGLINSAVHETAHYHNSDHDEYFTSKMSDITIAVADAIGARIQKFEKVLR